MDSGILIAEDSPLQRGMLVDILTTMGFDAFPTEDGEKALEVAQRAELLCAILDIHMPKLDGFSVLEKLQESHQSVPVIMISADVSAEAQAKAKRLGAAAFVSKPFSPDAVQEVISKILEAHFANS